MPDAGTGCNGFGASTESAERLCNDALSDWNVLSAALKGNCEEASRHLSHLLRCEPDLVRSLQLVDKLRLYLELPLPLRLLLHQHSLVLAVLPLPQLVSLLDSPPEQLAAALDELAPPVSPFAVHRGSHSSTISGGRGGSCSGARWGGPGETLLTFVRSGWLSYDPDCPGLASSSLSPSPAAATATATTSAPGVAAAGASALTQQQHLTCCLPPQSQEQQRHPGHLSSHASKPHHHHQQQQQGRGEHVSRYVWDPHQH
ncbi:hypothetical protein Agub_g8018, partial [Astrephomene gubernaculifera]